ncbi:MAG: DUF131 domain-containing protein [Thermoplasmata archaeon]|nr:DUF131 domain-containing protein [Thermoplasmata archaeon]
MNKIFISGLILFIISIFMMIIGVAKGYMGFAFFIFPVVYGSGIYAALAMLAMILSMLIIFLSFFSVENNAYDKKIDYGGMVLIGPIPILFGNSKNAILVSIIIVIVILILILLIL